MTPPPDFATLSASEKVALITALLARVDALVKELRLLRVENAALREKLNLPPKTPDNSSKPTSATGDDPCGKTNHLEGQSIRTHLNSVT